MCRCEDTEPNRCDRTELRRARKAHQCRECYREIKAGEQYEYYSAISYDGDSFSVKTCLRCVRVRKAHWAADPDCLPVVGDLLEQVGECSRENPEYRAKFRAAYRETMATP